MNSSEYIKKERPFFLEVFRHTGHSEHLLIAAELSICSRNAETPKTVSRCMVSGRFWAFSFDMSGFILAAVSFTANHPQGAVCRFRATKKAPYCYDAFVLLGRWSKGTLFHYLLCFFFLLTTVVPMAAPPLTISSANHNAGLAVSPVRRIGETGCTVGVGCAVGCGVTVGCGIAVSVGFALTVNLAVAVPC